MDLNKKKICLVGAGGRMGIAITSSIAKLNSSVLSAAIEHDNFSYLGKDSGLHSSSLENKILYSSNLAEGIQNSDVIIDFGSPNNSFSVLDYAVKYKKPIVIGVTGLSDDFISLLKASSLQIPIIQTSNMSIGVNLLFKLVETASRVLKDSFDIEIQDIHHRHKKDSPSGTARELKNILQKTLSLNEADFIFGRHGNDYPERNQKEIAIHSMRAGEVVGDHTVFFISSEERIEISHKAMDRKTFAVGAIKAAEYLVEQKIGLYSMFDVLGI